MFNLARVWENDFVFIVNISFLLLKTFSEKKNIFLLSFILRVYRIENNCIYVKYHKMYRIVR
jgi:hypothetical protein